MRATFLIFIVTVVGITQAAPVPVQHPKLSPEDQRAVNERALVYAQQTCQLILQIQSRSVSKLTSAQLLESALVGLFESARCPLPGALRKGAQKVSGTSSLIHILAEARKTVGKIPEWKKGDDLLASCRGIARKLDPDSGLQYLSESRATRLKGNHCGTGIILESNIGIGAHRIKEVIPGGPAQRAGLKAGDLLIALDGKKLEGQTSGSVESQFVLSDASTAETPINGIVTLIDIPEPPVSRKLTLMVQRKGQSPRKVLLTAEPFREETIQGVIRKENHQWDYFIDRKQKLAQVRVSQLARGTADELTEVLQELKSQGMKGLILDLRWCPGGFLSEAIQLAGTFLPDCTITTIEQREAKQHYPATQSKRFLSVPLVVLVNEETSGGAELIAAALQDHKRGIIAGQRTRGKGSVQMALYLDVPGVYFKVTNGYFLRASGKPLHRQPGSGRRDLWGVVPEKKFETRLSPALSKKLQQEWQAMTLRPGPSRKLLPLDDPSLDPQRQMALTALQEVVKKRARPAVTEIKAEEAEARP